MPPKGKAQDKKVKKIVEDKTFGQQPHSRSERPTAPQLSLTACAAVLCCLPASGLKNKNKSKKVQQYITAVAATASQTGKSRKQVKQEEEARKAKLEQKKAQEAAKKEQAELFKTVIAETKVPPGVDPKSVLCEFFKAGKCSKGAKCRYSHDLQVSLKSQKIDLYSDPRELAKTDTMDQWDTARLQEVVQRKAAGRMPPTDIVCKFFLDAIENGQYGWLWECDNGAACHYRHALPPGFVLKRRDKQSDSKAAEDEEDDKPSIEEEIEEERRKLNLSQCTPLTLELFLKWKEGKRKRKEEEVEKRRKEAAKSGGGGLHALSGRDLFRYDPSLFQDDEEADDEQYVPQADAEAAGDEQQQDDGDEQQPLYDRDAQGEVEVAVTEQDLGEDEDEREAKEGKEDGGGDADGKRDRAGKQALGSAAIDADLFLDEDDVELPDEDEDEDDEEEDEKKS